MTLSDESIRTVRKAAALARDYSEFEDRVLRWYGETAMPKAREIAAEVRGLNWVVGTTKSQPHAAAEDVRSTWCFRAGRLIGRLQREPSSIALLSVAALEAGLCLFPPYVTPLPGGYVLNSGHSFIFSPPVTSRLSAVVNVPLMATLMLGIAVVGVAVFLLLKRLEKRG